MAQPVPYNLAYSFVNWQITSPTRPLPADKLEVELNAIGVTTDQLLANLALVQRDDGQIANRSVGYDQLKTELALGIPEPTVWITNNKYLSRATVFNGSALYRAVVPHTSGVFATDLAGGKWELLLDLTVIVEAATSTAFSTRALMLANTTAWPVGTVLTAEKEDLAYEVAAAAVVDQDETTAGGAKLYLVSHNVIVARTRTALSALNIAAQKTASLVEAPRQGTFEWLAGDYTARIATDPGQGVYVQHATTAPTLGAWVRRTDRPISPRMFGAQDDTPSTSQHVALNRFFATLTAEYHPLVDWSGSYYVTEGLTFGSASIPILSKSIDGRMVVRTITGGAPEIAARVTNPTMFKLDGFGGTGEMRLPDLSLYGIGSEAGGASWATRNDGFHTGFMCYSSSRLLLDRLRVQNVTGFAYNQWANAGPNNNANTVMEMLVRDCGSGYVSQLYAANLTATFSNRVDAGSASSTGQTTTFDVTALPPLSFDAAAVGIQPIYVYFNNTMHLVSSINRGAGTITLAGWADLRTTTGTLAYVFGGGALAMGGDSGLMSIDLLDGLRSGIALGDAALYGAVVERLLTQFVGVGWSKGLSQSGATLGGRVGGYYEANLKDLMSLPAGSTRSQNATMTDEYALSYSKVQRPIIRSASNVPTASIPGTVLFVRKGVQIPPEGNAQNARDVSSAYGLDMNDRGRIMVLRRAAQTVSLTKFDEGLNSLIGCDSYMWVSIGTAANGGAPTSVTVNVPTANAAAFTANATSDVITATAPYLLRGSRVQLTTTIALPAPLALATDYWVVPQEDGVTYKLATSLANANSGTAGTTIDLTDVGTGTHTLTHMLTLNGGTAAVVFNALSGPTLFTVSQQILTNDYIVSALSTPATTGSTAMTGTALAGALAAYAKAADVAAPAAAPGDYVPGADVAAAGAVYVQAEANAVITRLNAATAALDTNNASIRALIAEMIAFVTRFNTAEAGLQSVGQKLKRHDDILFTAGVAKV